MVVPGTVPVAVGAGGVGTGGRGGCEVTGGGLVRVLVGDGEGRGEAGRVGVGDTEGRGGTGRVGVTDGAGRVGVTDGRGVEVWGGVGVTDGRGVDVCGGVGFVVGVCTGGGGAGGVRVGVGVGDTGRTVRVGGGAGGTGRTVRVGLGAGVYVGLGVGEAGALVGVGRGDGDSDGLGVGVGDDVVTEGDTVSDGDGVEWGAPPLSDDTSAQDPRPAPRATTAAPPAIHGMRRDGCRCRFMVLTVYPIADGLKPEPDRHATPARARPARCAPDGRRVRPTTIRPRARANRSWPEPEVSAAAHRRVCGDVSAGSAENRPIRSSRSRTHSWPSPPSARRSPGTV
ncbi:hypothetical protein [Streptomyces sp. NPDC001068]|uniref:hypothetical protein n=1 Tax=Streptomyces sp. NPDC001068 TaxID=3364544 RepID=UPI00369FA7EB